VRVVEIELAGQMHDDAGVGVIDARDGIHPAPRIPLHGG